MGATRQQVLDALYARISVPGAGVALGFNSSWTRIPLAAQLSHENQPAIIQTFHTEDYQREPRGLPVKRVYSISWSIFARCPDEETTGDVVLNPLLDALEETALKPDSPDLNFCTLDRLVYRVYIEGRVFREAGDLDSQAFALLPLKVIVP